ncbi:MAG: hypothetical protein CVU56_09850 [Deltaproteobacteria bacterium HGW-Deltaproteobacteria-14]|jgi:hypothetical protein|nr:MAG: hypothetical protein CVU56_09850 [Deltaproteobacteria bacterium HGW-Deltaproteobacteria-14]
MWHLDHVVSTSPLGAVFAIALLIAPSVGAQALPEGEATWTRPPAAEQSAARPALGEGQAALFVPAMTDPSSEPALLLRRTGETREARSGAWVVVAPGAWELLVGTGAPATRTRVTVELAEREYRVIEPTWAGLRVEVLNERSTAFRGAYEVLRLPERIYVGRGLGAKVSDGETVDTWLVPPGLYLVLSAGESYQARRNFATVLLRKGELVRWTLVLDEDSGDVLGAGQLEVEAQATTADDPWSFDLVFGGSVGFARTDAVLGKSDGMSLDLAGFIESVNRYQADNHLVYLRLYLEEEGSVDLPDDPYLRATDELRLESLYMYRVVGWFGPYVRFAAAASLVPGVEELDEEREVVRLDEAGDERAREPPTKFAEVSPAFAPIELRFGTGGRFDVAPVHWFELNSRVGIGGRQLFALGLHRPADRPDTPAFELQRVADVTQVGVELSLVARLNVTRYAQLDLEVDLLEPFDDPTHPVIDLRAGLAIRLASFASLSYTLRVIDDVTISEVTQLDQSVLLRFSWKVL